MSFTSVLIVVAMMVISVFQANAFTRTFAKYPYKKFSGLLDRHLKPQRYSIQFLVCFILLWGNILVLWNGINGAPGVANFIFRERNFALSFILVLMGVSLLCLLLGVGFGGAELLQEVRKKRS